MVDRLSKTPDDVDTVDDAARFLDLDRGAPEDEINNRYQELALGLHPDAGGNAEAFKALAKARDMLIQYAGEDQSEAEARTARGEGPFSQSGVSETGKERREQFEDTVEAVKLGLLEEHTGEDLSDFDTLELAIGAGRVSRDEVRAVETALQTRYGVQDLNLDDIAEVIASLIIQGGVSLGDVNKFADSGGVFTTGGKNGGTFGSGPRDGGGTFTH